MTSDNILYEIMDRLGGIDAKLAAGAQRHEEFKGALEKIDARTDKIETQLASELHPAVKTAVKAIGEMEPKLRSLMIFKGKIGAVIASATLIGGAAISLLWEGLKLILSWMAHYFMPPSAH